MSKLRFTILGSGTSQGIPVIACSCHVCKSTDPRDNRLRCSVLVEWDTENYVIDSGPDFRQQMLRADVQSLKGILFTHEHKDHVAGLDDVRAFNFKEQRDMDVFCTPDVEYALRREFHYIFENQTYPGIPKLKIHSIGNTPFQLDEGKMVDPVRALHYKMEVFGFRFGRFAYITDAKTIELEEIEKLKNVDVLIVNCLRIEPHISHFNLEEALQFIEAVQPKKAYLTHISHMFGTHMEIEAMLPPTIGVAFDGQVFEFET